MEDTRSPSRSTEQNSREHTETEAANTGLHGSAPGPLHYVFMPVRLGLNSTLEIGKMWVSVSCAFSWAFLQLVYFAQLLCDGFCFILYFISLF